MSPYVRRAAPWPARLVTVVLVVLALLLLGPAPYASAHAYLASSNPADGTVLDKAPTELRLGFSESVERSATQVDIVDGTGHHYVTRYIHQATASSATTESPMVLLVGLPALPRSTYRVTWETLSIDDLHRTSGVLVFGVQQAVAAPTLHEPRPAFDESGLRWLVFLGLAIALGGSLLSTLVRRRVPAHADLARRSEQLAVSGAVAAAVLGIGLLLLQVQGSGDPISRLLSGTYGHRWSVREAGLLLLVGATGARLVTGPRATVVVRRHAFALLALAALVSGVGTALLGHSASGTHVSPTRVAADALHLLAAGTWSGTVLVAAVVLLPVLRTGGPRAAAARATLRVFGWPAATCVAIMVVTGVYLASSVVGSVDAALVTVYGRVLLAKVAVTVVAGLLGLSTTVALRRGSVARRTNRVRARLPFEVLALLAALGLAAVLTSAQPATEPLLVTAPAPRTVPVVDRQVADLQETVAVRPNRPGANVVLVGVFDTRRPSPGLVTAVVVRVVDDGGRRSAPVAAELIDDGQWSAAVDLAAPGAVRIEVVARRAGLPEAKGHYRWVVQAPPRQTLPALVSTAPVAMPLRTLAGGLAALLLVVAAALIVVRRRRRRAPPRRRAASPAEHASHAASSAEASSEQSLSGPLTPVG